MFDNQQNINQHEHSQKSFHLKMSSFVAKKTFSINKQNKAEKVSRKVSKNIVIKHFLFTEQN